MNKYKNNYYNNMFPSSSIDLRIALSEMETKNAYFIEGNERVAHAGFNSLNDLNIYINEIQGEIKSYEQKWFGTKTQQGLNERLEELSAKIKLKAKIYEGSSEEIANPEFKKIQEEYKELLEIQKNELIKYKELKEKLEYLKETRRIWKSNIKEENIELLNYVKKITTQIENANKELKGLESSNAPENFKKLRSEALKEVITELENKLPYKTSEKVVNNGKETNQVLKNEHDDENKINNNNSGIKNINIRKDTLAKFKGKAAICAQSKPSDFDNIGDILVATSNVGLKRNNNEDCYVICAHPKLGDFSLALVADGMGGYESGEIASKYVSEELLKWFKELPVEMYENPELIKEELKNKIKEINNGIPAGGTTLACIITCANDTIVTTIGDSRVYAETENGLEQIGHDHSYAYLKGISNEDARFYIYNNKVTSGLGCRSYDILQTIIPRISYTSLHAMTDGITDIISEKNLSKILFSDKTLAEKQKSIIELANNSHNPDLKKITNVFRKEYDTCLTAGKDNATIVSCNTGFTLRR